MNSRARLAIAVGRPVVASTSASVRFWRVCPCVFKLPDGEPEGLVDGIVEFSLAQRELRAERGRGLRYRIEQGHSLDHWVDSVRGILGDVDSRGRTEEST